MVSMSMKINFQKIQHLLSSSDLSTQEQDNLLVLLSGTTDERLEPLAALFAEDSSWIRKISENFKAKQTAFAGKNKMAWAEILKGEEILLQDMAKEK